MLLSLRTWLGIKLFGVLGDRQWPKRILMSPNRVVKWPCEAPELEALRYVAANTTIPIPKVYHSHRWHGKLAIEMEYFKGCETLWGCWRSLSQTQKDDVVNAIASYVEQLQNLEPQDKYKISSTDGGPCRSIRVGCSKLFGPFENSRDFHQVVRFGFTIEQAGKVFGEQVAKVHDREYQTRFTHGDLGVQNILMRDGAIVALLDWECAGWYPEYWEYTCAQYNRVYAMEFYDMLDRKVKRYDSELEAEETLWRLYDQPLDQVDS